MGTSIQIIQEYFGKQATPLFLRPLGVLGPAVDAKLVRPMRAGDGGLMQAPLYLISTVFFTTSAPEERTLFPISFSCSVAASYCAFRNSAWSRIASCRSFA
jgi:hypothetical protein